MILTCTALKVPEIFKQTPAPAFLLIKVWPTHQKYSLSADVRYNRKAE